MVIDVVVFSNVYIFLLQVVDIWSLGVILHQLLHDGQTPHEYLVQGGRLRLALGIADQRCLRTTREADWIISALPGIEGQLLRTFFLNTQGVCLTYAADSRVRASVLKAQLQDLDSALLELDPSDVELSLPVLLESRPMLRALVLSGDPEATVPTAARGRESVGEDVGPASMTASVTDGTSETKTPIGVGMDTVGACSRMIEAEREKATTSTYVGGDKNKLDNDGEESVTLPFTGNQQIIQTGAQEGTTCRCHSAGIRALLVVLVLMVVGTIVGICVVVAQSHGYQQIPKCVGDPHPISSPSSSSLADGVDVPQSVPVVTFFLAPSTEASPTTTRDAPDQTGNGAPDSVSGSTTVSTSTFVRSSPNPNPRKNISTLSLSPSRCDGHLLSPKSTPIVVAKPGLSPSEIRYPDPILESRSDPLTSSELPRGTPRETDEEVEVISFEAFEEAERKRSRIALSKITRFNCGTRFLQSNRADETGQDDATEDDIAGSRLFFTVSRSPTGRVVVLVSITEQV